MGCCSCCSSGDALLGDELELGVPGGVGVIGGLAKMVARVISAVEESGALFGVADWLLLDLPVVAAATFGLCCCPLTSRLSSEEEEEGEEEFPLGSAR